MNLIADRARILTEHNMPPGTIGHVAGIRSRFRDVVRARELLCYLLRCLPEHPSWPEIGQALGFGHSTVQMSARRHAIRNGLVLPEVANGPKKYEYAETARPERPMYDDGGE